jgi:hypothetical protein
LRISNSCRVSAWSDLSALKSARRLSSVSAILRERKGTLR